jgi:uncharacterized protein (TIRG00374 family)
LSPRTSFWTRTLHLSVGLVPLAWGVWHWHSLFSVATLLLVGGLWFTLAVLLRRGRGVKGLAEFAQATVTLIFLDLALRHVRLADLWKVLAGLDPLLLLWGMCIFALAIALRGYRWYFLLERGGPVRIREAVATTFISFFGNFALPARAGEVIRILAIGQLTGLPQATAGATIALEKLSDILALLGMLLYLSVFSHLGGAALRWVGAIGSLIGLAIVLLLGAAVYLRSRFPLREEDGRTAGTQRMRRILHHFVEGMRPAADLSRLGPFLVYSALSWALIAYSCYAFLASEGLTVWLRASSRVGPVASSLLLVILVNASTLIPAGPGSAGPYQAAVILGFSMLGTGAGVAGSEAYHNAAAFSIVYWIGHAVPSLVVGGAIFYRSGLGLQVLRRAERLAAERLMPEEGAADESG